MDELEIEEFEDDFEADDSFLAPSPLVEPAKAAGKKEDEDEASDLKGPTATSASRRDNEEDGFAAFGLESDKNDNNDVVDAAIFTFGTGTQDKEEEEEDEEDVAVAPFALQRGTEKTTIAPPDDAASEKIPRTPSKPGDEGEAAQRQDPESPTSPDFLKGLSDDEDGIDDDAILRAPGIGIRGVAGSKESTANRQAERKAEEPAPSGENEVQSFGGSPEEAKMATEELVSEKKAAGAGFGGEEGILDFGANNMGLTDDEENASSDFSKSNTSHGGNRQNKTFGRLATRKAIDVPVHEEEVEEEEAIRSKVELLQASSGLEEDKKKQEIDLDLILNQQKRSSATSAPGDRGEQNQNPASSNIIGSVAEADLFTLASNSAAESLGGGKPTAARMDPFAPSFPGAGGARIGLSDPADGAGMGRGNEEEIDFESLLNAKKKKKRTFNTANTEDSTTAGAGDKDKKVDVVSGTGITSAASTTTGANNHEGAVTIGIESTVIAASSTNKQAVAVEEAPPPAAPTLGASSPASEKRDRSFVEKVATVNYMQPFQEQERLHSPGMPPPLIDVGEFDVPGGIVTDEERPDADDDDLLRRRRREINGEVIDEAGAGAVEDEVVAEISDEVEEEDDITQINRIMGTPPPSRPSRRTDGRREAPQGRQRKPANEASAQAATGAAPTNTTAKEKKTAETTGVSAAPDEGQQRKAGDRKRAAPTGVVVVEQGPSGVSTAAASSSSAQRGPENASAEADPKSASRRNVEQENGSKGRPRGGSSGPSKNANQPGKKDRSAVSGNAVGARRAGPPVGPEKRAPVLGAHVAQSYADDENVDAYSDDFEDVADGSLTSTSHKNKVDTGSGTTAASSTSGVARTPAAKPGSSSSSASTKQTAAPLIPMNNGVVMLGGRPKPMKAGPVGKNRAQHSQLPTQTAVYRPAPTHKERSTKGVILTHENAQNLLRGGGAAGSGAGGGGGPLSRRVADRGAKTAQLNVKQSAASVGGPAPRQPVPPSSRPGSSRKAAPLDTGISTENVDPAWLPPQYRDVASKVMDSCSEAGYLGSPRRISPSRPGTNASPTRKNKDHTTHTEGATTSGAALSPTVIPEQVEDSDHVEQDGGHASSDSQEPVKSGTDDGGPKQKPRPENGAASTARPTQSRQGVRPRNKAEARGMQSQTSSSMPPPDVRNKVEEYYDEYQNAMLPPGGSAVPLIRSPTAASGMSRRTRNTEARVPEFMRMQKAIDKARKQHVLAELNQMLQETWRVEKQEKMRALKTQWREAREEALRHQQAEKRKKIEAIEEERRSYVEKQLRDRKNYLRRKEEDRRRKEAEELKFAELKLVYDDKLRQDKLKQVARERELHREKYRRKIKFVMPAEWQN